MNNTSTLSKLGHIAHVAQCWRQWSGLQIRGYLAQMLKPVMQHCYIILEMFIDLKKMGC